MNIVVEPYLTHLGDTPLLTAHEEVELARRVEAGVYAAHLLEAGEPVEGLADVVADGQAARDHLVRANLRLVVSIAKRYAHRGISFADVVQDGNLGLVQAVERFDHAKGFRFSTCATWWIRKAIQQGLERARTVRLPIGVLDQLARLGRQEEAAGGQNVERVAWLQSLPHEFASLDCLVGERHTSTLGELLEDEDSPGPERIVEQQILRAELGAAIDTLAPRQATIVRMRYGLDGYGEHATRQIADRYGLTCHWVRQLEKESLARLRSRAALQEWASAPMTA